MDDEHGDYEPPYDLSKECIAKLRNIKDRMGDLIMCNEDDKSYLRVYMKKLCDEMMKELE